MSKKFDTHIPDEILDDFAMDMLSETECACWEEHLLICAHCQDRLEEADEYISVMKSAAEAISRPGPVKRRRRLAKPMIAAVTHAALLWLYISVSTAVR